MSASLRLPNALLAMLMWSTISAASLARNPDAPAEREKSQSKGNSAYEVHKVRKGETLWSVAMDYHTSAGEIMDMNDMDNSHIKEGQNLKIPHAISNGGAPVVRQKTHVVAEDETLSGIARVYKIKEENLLRANPDVNPRRVRPGMRLVIPSANLPPGQSLDAPPRVKESPGIKESAGGVVHVVKDNDTFSSIAKQYHLSVDDVMAANPGIKPERLQEGMKLKLPGARPPAKDSSPAKKSSFIAKPGGTTERLSHRDDSTPNAAKRKTVPFVVSNERRPEQNKAPYGPPMRIAQPVEKTFANKKPAGPAEFSYEKKMVINKPNYQVQAAPPSRGREGERIMPHTVATGESIDSIANRNNVSAQRIRDYNHLGATGKLRPGDEIMIPLSSSLAAR